MDTPDLFREVLLMQLRGAGALVLDAAHDMGGDRWARSIVPGANPPGFIAWHMARSIDWAVQCGVRGVPEVATQGGFSGMEAGLGIGIGLTLDEAIELASRIDPPDVAAYATAVIETSVVWLSAVPVEVLTAPNSLATNQGRAEPYRRQAHLDEVANLFDIPNWHLLVRPAGGHVRVHAGELEVLAAAST